MKYAIFGTGKYFLYCYRYLNDDDVLFLIDNDENKWGTSINGKVIYSPINVNYDQCDFILILVMQYDSIVQQLLSYGILYEKIKLYYDIPYLYNMQPKIVSNNCIINFNKWKIEHCSETVFVCSHEFSRTGVPIALMHLCKLLKKMGYDVLFSALNQGNLELELCVEGIDYVKDFGLFYKSELYKEMMRTFNFIFLGSVVTSTLGKEIANMNIPIIWWLHESSDIAYKHYPLIINNNIHYFGGGKRVLHKFKEYYPNGSISEMLYFLPDEEIKNKVKENSKIIFALAGTIEKRKGQDIFIEAIGQLPEEVLARTEFLLIGTYRDEVFFTEIKHEINKNKHIRWIGELTQAELREQYKSIDVLVCPSRDDPMPIVVTQALQNGIPCIVSDEVGQMEYLSEGKGGSVFASEDAKELARYICEYVSNTDLILQKGKDAKIIFEDHFSEKAMRENLTNIIKYFKGCD